MIFYFCLFFGDLFVFFALTHRFSKKIGRETQKKTLCPKISQKRLALDSLGAEKATSKSRSTDSTSKVLRA